MESYAELLEKQIPRAPTWFAGALAAQLSVQAAIRIFRIVDEVLDAVSVDLDCRGDFAYQALAARIEMHAYKRKTREKERRVSSLKQVY